jgi:hypothetical protein
MLRWRGLRVLARQHIELATKAGPPTSRLLQLALQNAGLVAREIERLPDPPFDDEQVPGIERAIERLVVANDLLNEVMGPPPE